MGNSSGDLREFLRNAEALKRQTVQKQQKNLTEEPEEYRDARRKAMRLLEHMDRTEKGLREKLRQAGFTSQAVDHALTYVEAQKRNIRRRLSWMRKKCVGSMVIL